MKYLKYLAPFILTLGFASNAAALSIFTVPQGGTGSSTLTGILKGNGTSAIQTAVPGVDYLTSLTGAASSTLLSDNNTFSGINNFTSATGNWGGTWQGNAPAAFQPAGSYESPLSFSWPLLRVLNAISWNGLATSSDATIGNLTYFSGARTLANVATSSLSVGTSISSSGTLGALVGGTASQLSLNMANSNTWTAQQNFSDVNVSNIATTSQLCFATGECMTSPTVAGAEVQLFHWNGASEIATYEKLMLEPDFAGTNTDESCAAQSGTAGGYCTIDSYVSTTTELALDSLPAGVWAFHYYTYANSTIDNSKLEANIYKRNPAGTETYLFQATSTDIQSTTVLERQFAIAQGSYDLDPTDRLVIKVRGWTDSGSAKTIHFLYGGASANYSHIETPISFGNFNFARKDLNETITGAWTFGTGTTTINNARVTGNLQVDGYLFAPVTLTTTGDTTIGGVLTVTGNTKVNVTGSTQCLKVDTNGIISGTGSVCGTVTAVTASYPLVSSGGATPNLTYVGLATSTTPVVGNLAYWTGGTTFGTVATTTVSCAGTASCTAFTILGASPITITGSAAASVDWVFAQNYSTTNFTASSTLPLWAKGIFYASSTSIFQGVANFLAAPTINGKKISARWSDKMSIADATTTDATSYPWGSCLESSGNSVTIDKIDTHISKVSGTSIMGTQGIAWNLNIANTKASSSPMTAFTAVQYSQGTTTIQTFTPNSTVTIPAGYCYWWSPSVASTTRILMYDVNIYGYEN